MANTDSSAPAHPSIDEREESPRGCGNTPEVRTTGRLASVANTKSNDSSGSAHPSTEEKKLTRLEERLSHELLDDDDRQELRDRVLRLRRRLGR